MRLANSTDPVVHTQPPKTTRHYVRIPGFDMFILIGIQTHSAKNVQGITHYFSKVRMWRHVATKRPEPLFEHSHQVEWWEQDQDTMPVTPLFAHCVVSDSSGPSRTVWYNFNGPENSRDPEYICFRDLKRKAVSQEGRQSTLKFMTRGALPPHLAEGPIKTELGDVPENTGVWPVGELKPPSSPHVIDL